MESAAVVGAGPAGLAAGWRLAERGVAVTLFEARPEVGGRMRSDALDGATVDVAVQLLSSTFDATLSLAAAVGAKGSIVRSPGRDALWRRGRAHPVVYGSVSSMARSTALSMPLKLRLAAKYLPYLASRMRGLDANDPARTGGDRWDDESIAEWGEAELGDDFLELLAYPLLATYYGTPPERTSAPLYHALARVGLDVRVLAVRGGVGALPAAVAVALEARGASVRRDVRVTRVVRKGERVEVGWADGEEPFDGVVVATPAAAARPLLVSDSARQWLDRVSVAPTATLALLLDRPLDADWFGLTIPRGEAPGRSIVGVCLQERKAKGLVPPGSGLLLALPAPRIAASLAEVEPQDVADELLPALEEIFPGVGARVVRARSYPLPEGYTEFLPGHLRHILRFDPAALPPGITLAGDYLVAPTVEGAVRSGIRAADHLLGSRPGSRPVR
ncbi:MAG TPA: FAD-dependent oxidoreductase [Longimicrobiales bacterium]|nr:FAD-dependent oxidoreductase [Longimicrobiales bacterium]